MKNKSKKILTVMVIAPGHSIHTKRFIEALLSHGNSVVGVCEQNPFPEKRKGFRFVLQSPCFHPGAGITHLLLDKFLGFKTVERILMKVTGLYLKAIWLWFRPDIVHVLWLDYWANACLSGGLTPLALSCWGTDINQHFVPNADTYKRELCCQALSKADLTICDTLEMIEKCKNLAGGVTIKSELLHLGVDTNKFSPQPLNVRNHWREQLQIPKDAKVLLSLRGWHPRYGHHLILEAFSKACTQIPGDIFLVFKIYNLASFPDAKEYEERIIHRAKELGISDRIRWLNAVSFDQLPDIYAMSDIIINYPDMDTLGITLMEAASCKKQIITCDLPGYRGTFVEKYAKMVPYGDLQKLEQAIVEAAASTDDSLLNKARHSVEENYSCERFSQKLKLVNENLAFPKE